MIKFCVKVFRTSLFLWWIWFIFGMMIDTGPKFYSVPSPHPCMTLRSGHRLRTFMLKFYVKAFRTSLFPNPVVYLFHVWYDDRCWSKILCSTIPNPVHDFKVQVTDLRIFVLKFVFKFLQCLFLWSLWWIDSCLAWWSVRNWSKILYGTIPNPEGHRLRIFI